jgi:RimJ/RimL family protein N-acetyltransferase
MENGQYKPTKPDDYGPDLFNDWVIDFAKRHQDQPFVIYNTTPLTHPPHVQTPDPDHPGQRKPGTWKNNVEYLDYLMGKLVKAIDDAGLRAWFDQALANAAETMEVPFATIDQASDRAIGSSRYMTITPEHRRLEIGWTWVGTAFQRTGANREAKLLQLTHAFEGLDAQRVEFKTHARNVASRTALLGIGATFEGVLRHHTIMPDGSNRDSAFYGVIASEWPAVKAHLEALVSR